MPLSMKDIMNSPWQNWKTLQYILKYLNNSTYYDLLFDVLLNDFKFFLCYIDDDHGQDVDQKNPQQDMCLHLTIKALIENLFGKIV